MRIPEKYYKGKHPVVSTVGELKACLDELPDELPAEAEFGIDVEVLVCDHGKDSMRLKLRGSIG